MPSFSKLYYRCTQKATSRVLDGNQKGDSYSLIWNQGDYQRWVISDLGDGYCRITQRATGRVLDGNADGKIYTLDWNGGDYQKWKIEDLGGGCYKISQKATGRVLDGNRKGMIYSLAWNSGDNQRWLLDSPQAWNQLSSIHLDEHWTDEVQGVAQDGSHWLFSCNAQTKKPGHKMKSVYVFDHGQSLKDNHWKSQLVYQRQVAFPIPGTCEEDSHWGQLCCLDGYVYVAQDVDPTRHPAFSNRFCFFRSMLRFSF